LLLKTKLEGLPKNASVFIEDVFRKRLIESAIKKAGSLNQLGKIMGYTGSAPNWNIKQILVGNQGIPLFRLKRLCDFMNLRLSDVEDYVERVRSNSKNFET